MLALVRHGVRINLKHQAERGRETASLRFCAARRHVYRWWRPPRRGSAVSGRLGLDRTSARRVLAQRVMDAVLLVIADVLAEDPAKVFFIHRDDMVEDLAPAASDPSFGGSVLPGRADARPHWFQSGRIQERDDLVIEDGIVIQNGVAIGSRLGKRRSELLQDPFRDGCRVTLKCRILRRSCSMMKKQ